MATLPITPKHTVEIDNQTRELGKNAKESPPREVDKNTEERIGMRIRRGLDEGRKKGREQGKKKGKLLGELMNLEELLKEGVISQHVFENNILPFREALANFEAAETKS